MRRPPACSDEAMELLRRGWPPGEEPKYDTNHALVLCRMHNFRPGLIFLYEHMRLFREVMQVRGGLEQHGAVVVLQAVLRAQPLPRASLPLRAPEAVPGGHAGEGWVETTMLGL